LQRRTVSVPILDEKQTGELFSPGLAREKFASYYAVPLIAKGQVRGVLEIFHRSILKPSDDWFEFLATLAGQTAVAIESASLFQDLQYSNMELSAAMDATIESWSQALEVSGREAPEHTQRVVHWCLQVAQEMHVDEKDLLDLRRGAFLHDIGKMSIPESILNKPAALDEAEWQLIHRHPLAAFNFLSQIKPLASAMDIPRYHHERWDGSGYPDGLKGRQIPLAARIFAVVDVFDSMTTARPFRQAQDRKAALEFIRAASGRLFDPQVVDAFSQIIWGYI
jgi:HD-GYP domain-containing protein (c-di-GMP phosphodiesterase class II)